MRTQLPTSIPSITHCASHRISSLKLQALSAAREVPFDAVIGTSTVLLRIHSLLHPSRPPILLLQAATQPAGRPRPAILASTTHTGRSVTQVPSMEHRIIHTPARQTHIFTAVRRPSSVSQPFVAVPDRSSGRSPLPPLPCSLVFTINTTSYPQTPSPAPSRPLPSQLETRPASYASNSLAQHLHPVSSRLFGSAAMLQSSPATSQQA